MRKPRKTLAALLALALTFSLQTPFSAYAEGEGGTGADPGAYKVTYTYSGNLPSSVMATLPKDETEYENGTVVTAKSPSSSKVTDNDTVYTFGGWDEKSKTINGSDINFTGSWSSEDVLYKIEGKATMYPYKGSPSSGSPLANETITLTLASDKASVTTGSDGTFSYTITDKAQVKADGNYAWSIAANDKHYAATGTAKGGDSEGGSVSNSLAVQERYKASDADFEYVESDLLKKIGSIVWVKTAGTYSIKASGGKKLSNELDGPAADSLDVTVDSKGNVSPFYVYDGENCSQVVVDRIINIDRGAPVINTVSTEAANDNTYVKSHGIYGKTKAELILTADIEEDTFISDAYLVRTKDGESVKFDEAKVKKEADGTYSVTIPLPNDQTILDAELVKLVVKDIFGNTSNEALIRTEEGEDGSKVTLEQIAPKISKSESGKKSSYGWYSEMPKFEASASDNLSGLASLKITGEGSEIAKEEYENKVWEEKKVSGSASIGEESDDGTYTYTVEAKDNSGNTATEDFKVKIDLVKPQIKAEGAESGEHYSSSPKISITEDEKYYFAEGNRIYVNVCCDGKTTFDKTFGKVNKASIPTSAFDKDGEYSVTIFAKDAADNESETISYKFIKDATAPVIVLSGVKNGKFYNKKQTVTAKVTERNYKTNKVSITAVKKLGGDRKNMGFPWANKAEVSTSSKAFGETGTYTITANAEDKAGNKAKQKTVSFTVDTKPPVIKISGVKNGGVYTYGQSVSPKVEVTDDYLDTKSISYTKGGNAVKNVSFEQVKENDGLYTLTVTATDKAGNTSREQVSFTVNRFGSYFIYNDAIKALSGKAVQNVDDDLVITEKNVSKVIDSDAKIFLDGKAIGAKGKTKADESGPEKTYRHVFAAENFETEGIYEINVASEDEAGNKMESREENGPVKFYVDRTKPTVTVSGIDPKGNKAEKITATISATDLLAGVSEVKAYIDGEEVGIAASEENDGTYTFEIGKGLRQKIRITATDRAGNTEEITSVASVSPNAASLFLNRFGIAIGVIVAAVAGLLIFLLAKRRREEDEEEDSAE